MRRELEGKSTLKEERWQCIDGKKRTEKDVEVESVGEKQTVFLDERRRSRAVS